MITSKPQLRKIAALKTILPTIHINGTHKNDLIENYLSVLRSLETFIARMQTASPHPRDYPNGNYQHAKDFHNLMIERIEAIQNDIGQLVLLIDEQK